MKRDSTSLANEHLQQTAHGPTGGVGAQLPTRF